MTIGRQRLQRCCCQAVGLRHPPMQCQSRARGAVKSRCHLRAFASPSFTVVTGHCVAELWWQLSACQGRRTVACSTFRARCRPAAICLLGSRHMRR
jgi:hypothetical protein